MGAESKTIAQTSQGQEFVLLVNDDPTNLQELFKTLSKLRHKLLVAKSGKEALAVARRTKPCLILLDVMMPGMDGYETCVKLENARRGRHLPSSVRCGERQGQGAGTGRGGLHRETVSVRECDARDGGPRLGDPPHPVEG
jgi:response regulator RpfG family c-di-GMP phosphodiesterase